MKKTALINIDFINDFVHEKGAFGPRYAPLVQERGVIEKANEVIRFARENDIFNIYIKVGYSDNYKELSKDNPFFGEAIKLQAFKLDSWGTEFHENLDYLPNELVIVKPRISVFYATKLENILLLKNIEQVMITGVATDLAVQLLARDAVDRDYNVIICKDACATFSNTVQEATLESLSGMTTIVSNSELSTSLLK